MEADAGGPIADLLAAARPAEAAIRFRWQRDAVPPWRRVEPTMVCEVRVTNLDLLVAGRFSMSSNCRKRVSVTDVPAPTLVVIAGRSPQAEYPSYRAAQ